LIIANPGVQKCGRALAPGDQKLGERKCFFAFCFVCDWSTL